MTFVLVAVVLIVIGLVHFWLWKRLIRDTVRSRTVRRVGAVVFAVLGLLIPATFAGVANDKTRWIAWPGYLWIGLLFYLILALAVMELVRLALRPRQRQDRPQRQGRPESQERPEPQERPERPGEQERQERPERPGERERPATEATAATASEPESRRVIERGRTGHDGDSTSGAESPVQPGIERRLLLARGTAITAGLAAAAISGYGIKTALGRPRLDRVQLPITKLPRALDGTRLAVVSDIHLGPLTGTHHTGRIVDLINSVDADIVCIVGDLVDGTVAELGRFAEPLRNIRSRRGAYFVTGNHEYFSGFQPWVDEVRSLGVRPLRNERLELGGLDLAGVNDLNGTRYGDAPDFARALGDRDRSRPVILMAHQPKAAREAARYGVDLQVSGHTHGGQMAPFNLVVRLEQPLVSGFGRVDGVPVYVTDGAGFWGPPMRVGAPPQVTVIDLRAP